MKSRIYLSEKVPNRDRRFGSVSEYYPATVVDREMSSPAMFTEQEILRAMDSTCTAP